MVTLLDTYSCKINR